MPIPQRYRDELQRSHETAHLAAERDRRRAFAVTILQVLGWTVAGLFLFGLALHVNEARWGEVLRWASPVVWVGGVWVTLMRAHRRGEERGDW